MNLEELIEAFRTEVSDEAAPYLWSDSEVLRFAVDAQDMFVRKTGGIAESGAAGFAAGTPGGDLCVLTLTTGSPWSAHSPYVLRIRSGRLQTGARDVEFISEGDLNRTMVRDYGWTVGVTLRDDDLGTVTHGILGMQDNYVRWYRVPSADDTCRLHVFRLPYPRITDENGTVQLEIDERHHEHLLKWMKHRAYSKQDAEARDDAKALQYRAEFEAYCEEAGREITRQRYKPRTVQFGGI